MDLYKIRFAVYPYNVVLSKGKIITRYFIVLKNDYFIIGWTDFHRYIKTGKTSRVKIQQSENKQNYYFIIMFLNYCFFEKYNIKKLTDITTEMVEDFLKDYSSCQLPSDNEYVYRNNTTIDKCVISVFSFIELFTKKNPNSKVNFESLFSEKLVFSKSQKQYIEKKVPDIELCSKEERQPQILRDIPEEAFQILMDVILKKYTNILMLAALGAFGGLRPSEACNVRRSDSILGPGIFIERHNFELIGIEIDLTNEYNLRSDNKSVGKIKKHRMARIYPAFHQIFSECYDLYMEYIDGKYYEPEFGALTTNRQGKAITYASYYQEFQKAVNYAQPIMKKSKDPKTVKFGMELDKRKISPHIFRHYFTVKLVLLGENEATIQSYRGDKKVSSALDYLQNKGEIQKEYKNVANNAIDYSLWKANKINQT